MYKSDSQEMMTVFLHASSEPGPMQTLSPAPRADVSTHQTERDSSSDGAVYMKLEARCPKESRGNPYCMLREKSEVSSACSCQKAFLQLWQDRHN